jgi:hypothetical protein
LLHNDDLIEVENSVELVRDSDDSMCSELLAQEALNHRVGLRVETVDHVSKRGRYDLEVGTYCDVASSSTNTLLLSRLKSALAMQNN